MKKILPRLALLALPFVLYYAVFLIFEPYDYFGVKGGAVNEDSVITRVRAYLSAPENAVILGDSRMAHFDPGAVEAASGRRWSNLAFGGASLGESIDLFYMAAEQNPALNTCYFGVSFYTLRAGDDRSRTGAIETVASNPAAYLLNFDYNADMLNELLLCLQGVQTGATRDAGSWEEADYLDEHGAPLPYRRNLIAYAATLYANLAHPDTLPAIETSAYTDAHGAPRERCENPAALTDAMRRASPADSAYTLNEENLRRLAEVADFCAARGIALTFVLPPVDKALHEFLLTPLGLEPQMQSIRAALLATGARVRDFEVEPEYTFEEEQYYDGFHLDVERGLPQFTQILFGLPVSPPQGRGNTGYPGRGEEGVSGSLGA